MNKIEKCKYSYPSIHENGCVCVVDGWDDDQIKEVTCGDCEKCKKFKSKYIEYPIAVNKIENTPIDFTGFGHQTGCLCEVVLCDKKYKNKCFIGFYLGDLPLSIDTRYNEEEKIITNSTVNNPAIFIPELKKIVYGCESWWREIKSVEDFKGISKEDIENTWYVKCLKELSKK